MPYFHGFFSSSVLPFGWGESSFDARVVFDIAGGASGGFLMATQAQVGELELGLLRTFLAVVHNGSIGKAAASLEMTQPAVSQQMLRLEKVIGQKLFARGRNGITLTAHGELLITYANRAIELNEETLVRLRHESLRSRIAIGASADVALAGLLPALKRSQSIHPDLELKIVVTAPDRLEDLLKAGELDMVIASPRVVTGAAKAKWLVPLQWAAQKQLRIDKSKPLPLVVFERPCQWQDEMLDSLRQAGWEWRIAFESSSLDAIVTATRSGLGVSLLPTEAIRNFKLTSIADVGLPLAPQIEFGIFPGVVLSNQARTVLEIAMSSIFQASAKQ